MATLAPLNYIEITEEYGDSVPRIAGTRIRVSEVVIMHLYNDSPIEWIVENFEVLDYAKVHAALAYYYAHQAEIDAEIAQPSPLAGNPDVIIGSDWIAERKARLAAQQETNHARTE